MHFLHGRGARHFENAIGQRRTGQWHAHGQAVQPAAQFGEYFSDGCCRSRGRGDQAAAAGTRAPQVLVRRIHDGLRVGQRMDGGDAAVAYAHSLVDHLHHGRQAIGGAGSRRHDAVHGGVEQVVVHPDHGVQHALLLHRRRHHHARHALLQIRLQLRRLAELAGGLQHHVAAGPIGLGDLLVARDWNCTPFDQQVVAVMPHLAMPATMHGIEVQQVRQRGGIRRRVIDLGEGQFRANGRVVQRGPQGEPAHAAEAVDADAYVHWICLLSVVE